MLVNFMERANKLLVCLSIIIVLLAIFCCESSRKKPEEKKGKRTEGLAFIDSSNGLPSTGQWRQGIDFYDINGDGHIDILAPPSRLPAKGNERPVVWYGNGKGQWSQSRLDVPQDIRYDYGSIAVSDFDGDGIADIALAIHGEGVKALKGKGGAKYVDSSAGIPPKEEFSSRAIVSADFNNDGVSDIAALSEIILEKGSANPKGVLTCFSSKGNWICSFIGDEKETQGLLGDQLAVGDINGDGNRDIAVGSLNHTKDLIVWIGDGKGGFTPFNKGLPRQMHYPAVCLADLNRDGRDDLVASVGGFGKEGFVGLKAFLSLHDGFKEVSDGLPTKEVFYGVKACDLDGDGSVEILGGTGEGEVKIFAQKENRWHEVKVSGFPQKALKRIYNLYCIDLNGDGFKDIAVNYAESRGDGGGIRVFLNVPSK